MLIVHPHIYQGGAEKHIVYFAYWLRKLGAEAKIATLSVNCRNMPKFTNQLDFIMPNRQIEQSLIGSDKVGWTWTYWKELLVLRKIVKKNAYWADVIDAHHFPAHWSAFHIGKPVIWICHESYTGCFPGQTIETINGKKKLMPVPRRFAFLDMMRTTRAAFDRYVVSRGVNKIIVLDREDFEIVKASYNRKAMLLPPGVDFEFYKNGNGKMVLSKYGLSMESFIVLQVGSLSSSKNQIASIEAAYLLRGKINDFKLILIGTGPLKSELTRMVKELQLENNVIFTGQISEDELRDWYHACHINLFPSKDQSWGMAPFEGLAAGKIPVVSKKCGSSEVIRRNRIGILIDPTPKDIANAILKIYRKTEVYSEMTDRGRKFVEDEMSWKKYTEEVLKLMNEFA